MAAKVALMRLETIVRALCRLNSGLMGYSYPASASPGFVPLLGKPPRV